jgi:two-component system phosphate regulon sensor histidine kinase PhoR
MYNAACLNLLDTNESLKDKDIGTLFQLTDHLDRSIKLDQLLEKAERATTREDLTHTFADGEAIRLELTFAPIKSSYGNTRKDRSQSGYIIIARDVTKAKSLEEERDEFISVVSHELRTPITIVEGTLSNLQVLGNRPTPPSPELLKSMLDTAHDQIMYLAKMVNDLSTLSRAERGVADAVEPIVVQDLMHHLHNEYQKDAESKGLHLNLDLGTKLGTIHVSRLYVEELLQNFITNAIKYTKEGSVTMTASQSKGVVTFTVKDTGIGISRGEQDKIFNKFYRSEDYRIRETGGTGLGLYVSTKLASKLGTHVKLTSRLNHGSTFAFELPTEL